MGEVLPMPAVGDLFTDVRGGGRTMRVSYHADRDAVVVSLWVGTVCRGSFRLAGADVDRLLATLSGMRAAAERAGDAAPGPDGGRPPAPPGAPVRRIA